MFDNLIGQDQVRRALQADIEASALPPALLFSGPPASGKLTAALEAARVLSCEAPGAARGAWTCPCPACARHRVLAHTDLMLLGNRALPEEIGIAADMLLRDPGPGTRHFFIRAVRKLLRRFDRALWEQDASKLSKAAPLLREIEEALPSDDAATPGAPPESAVLSVFPEDTVRGIVAACAKLEAFVPDAPPVAMIRSMELWARTAPLGNRKTVVIENADRMLDSARNAMLKILEEPPETVRFILITSKRAAVMATILSRSRTYPFAQRGSEAVSEVLRRVFRTGERADSLAAFLEAKRPFAPAEAKRLAEALADAILSGSPLSAVLKEITEATKEFGAKDPRFEGSFAQFLRAFLEVAGARLRHQEAGPDEILRATRWSALAREAALQHASYNRNPELVLRVMAERCGGAA